MITILYGYLNIKQCACNTRDWCLILCWEDPNFHLIYNALHVNNIVLVVFFVNLLSQLIACLWRLQNGSKYATFELKSHTQKNYKYTKNTLTFLLFLKSRRWNLHVKKYSPCSRRNIIFLLLISTGNKLKPREYSIRWHC